jgi:hypothetical protein
MLAMDFPFTGQHPFSAIFGKQRLGKPVTTSAKASPFGRHGDNDGSLIIG